MWNRVMDAVKRIKGNIKELLDYDITNILSKERMIGWQKYKTINTIPHLILLNT